MIATTAQASARTTPPDMTFSLCVSGGAAARRRGTADAETAQFYPNPRARCLNRHNLNAVLSFFGTGLFFSRMYCGSPFR